MKEVKEDTNKGKDNLHSWIGRHNIFKMTVLSKVIYRLNIISTKIPTVFCRNRKTHHKIHRDFQGNLNSQDQRGTKLED